MLLREEFPDLKVRFINVVDPVQTAAQHRTPPRTIGPRFRLLVYSRQARHLQFPRLSLVSTSIGLSTHEPWQHARTRLQGEGEHHTPLELAINNEIDRFSLAIDAIDRVPKLQRIGAHAKERFRNRQIECRNYAYQHGVDDPNVAGWKWPA